MASSSFVPLTGLADDALRALVQINIVCGNTAFRTMTTAPCPGVSCVAAFKTTMSSYLTMMNVANPAATATRVVQIAVGRLFVGMPLVVVWSDSPTKYRCTLQHSDAIGYYLQSPQFANTAEVVLFDPILDEWHIPGTWFNPKPA